MTPTWQSDCGQVQLWLGDCREILPHFPRNSVDMVWTDPPYGHSNHDGDWNARLNDHRGIESKPIENDSQELMRDVVDGMLNAVADVLKRDCCCCCCCCCGGGPKPTFAWVANRLDSGGFAFFHSVIWDKVNPGLGWRYRRQHEMVMVAHRSGGKLAWNEETPAQANVIRISKPRDDAHPNIKPVELVQRFINQHTKTDGVCLDPFMGSATTGIACLRTGRKFIGVEISPKCFEIAKERIQRELAQLKLPL